MWSVAIGRAVSEDYRKIELVMALRNRGIRDTGVLAAIERVPRERFVDPAFAAQAYADQSLPIECGQTVSQPFVVAYMTEKLRIDDRVKVLEIGTGSGYQTAVLSHLCRRVYTIERYRTLLQDAEARFRELGLSNVTAMAGDGTMGWPGQAPFDRIIVTASAAELPRPLVEQLKPGGILVAPVDAGTGGQELVRVTIEDGKPAFERLLPVRFVPLAEGMAREL